MRWCAWMLGLVLLLPAADVRSGEEGDRAERIRREVDRTHFDPILGRRTFVAETGHAPWLVFVEVPADADSRDAAIFAGRRAARDLGRLSEVFDEKIRPGLARAARRAVPSLRDEVLKVWLHPDFESFAKAWKQERGALDGDLVWARTSSAFWRKTPGCGVPHRERRCPSPRRRTASTCSPARQPSSCSRRGAVSMSR